MSLFIGSLTMVCLASTNSSFFDQGLIKQVSRMVEIKNIRTFHFLWQISQIGNGNFVHLSDNTAGIMSRHIGNHFNSRL